MWAKEGRVFIGREQWPHRGPPSPRVGCTEWRDELQDCSNTLTDQGIFLGKGCVLLGRGQWRCGDPPSPPASSEWRRTVRVFKYMERSGYTAGERSSASRAKTITTSRSLSLQPGRNDHRDELQGKSKRRVAWCGRVGKVPVHHDQDRLPRRCNWFLLAPIWRRELPPVTATVQLVHRYVISLLCMATEIHKYLLNTWWLTELNSTRWFELTLVLYVVSAGGGRPTPKRQRRACRHTPKMEASKSNS
jgi:hypothetical protein